MVSDFLVVCTGSITVTSYLEAQGTSNWLLGRGARAPIKGA